jgi:endogenous inhibitor of DNA gyrase (YacG/DUF329 family)
MSIKNGEYKECEWCKKNVYVQNYRIEKFRFCSNECYHRWLKVNDNPNRNRKTIICLECGKNVLDVPNCSKQRFCSIKCFGKYIKKQNKNRDLVKKKVDKKCLNCGVDYKIWSYRKDSNKFCCLKCFDDYRRDFLKCPSCKKLFSAPKNETRKYCSQECAAKGILKRKSKFHMSVCRFLKSEYEKRYIEEKYVTDTGFKHFLDFVIDGHIDIECDGTYWHCDQDVYNENYYNSKLKKTAKEIWDKDKERDIRLEKAGYNIIRIKEKPWSENPKCFFEKLKEAIDEVSKNKKDKQGG